MTKSRDDELQQRAEYRRRNRTLLAAKARAYYAEHLEERRAYDRRRNAVNHADRVRQHHESWLRHHDRRNAERRAEYKMKNPEDLRRERRDYYLANRAKIKARAKEYSRAHPDRVRDRLLRKNFGIGLVEYDALLRQQNNLCALCGGPFHGTWRNKWAPVVDHDHETNMIRGIVHSRCNIHIIGANTPESAKMLVNYLSRPRTPIILAPEDGHIEPNP